MTNRRIFQSAFLVLLIFLASCKHQDINLADYPEICFEEEILPIFQSNCVMCHGPGGEESGYPLNSYNAIMKGVVSGKPFESQVYKVLSATWVNMMPPDNPISKENRTLIRLWIEQGAQNTSCPDTMNISLVSSHGTSTGHKAGENCMTCHTSGGTAPGYFNAAGTVYDSSKTNTYPNARVKLYTQLLAAGNLVAEIEADENGYFYTTSDIDFSAGLYPVVEGTSGEVMYMGVPTFSGQCYSCHGYDGQDKIFIGSIPIGPVGNDSICFEYDVLPILLSSCALSNCHDPITHEEDIILTSYWNVMNSDEDELVVPGDPNESKMYEAITETDPEKRMPPPPQYNALSQEQIDIIFKWISEGALDRDCSAYACDTLNVGFASTIWPIVQSNCKGCHSGASPNGGINLENYGNVKAIADNQKLINVIHGTNGLPQMPPTFSLSDCNKRQIEIWIADGSPNN